MKTMFRRIFSMTTLVLCLSFVLIGAGVRLEFYRYFEKEQRENLITQAKAVSEIAEAFDVLNSSDEKESFRIGIAFSSHVTDSDILVTDNTGKIVFCSDYQLEKDFLGKSIPVEEYDFAEESYFFKNNDLDSIFTESKFYAVAPFYQMNSGELSGYILVFAEPEQIGNILSKTTNIFLFIALIVLIIAVAASSYVANKETKPLKELVETVKAFGQGNYSARVSTDSQTVEIAELSQSFNQMADSLEYSEKKRREFIANVSHELKTPMTTIAGFMDGMIDGTIPPEQHEKYMRTVAEEVRRLSRLVRSMLEISRIQDVGMPEEKKRNFDICETLGRTLLSFEQKINHKQLNIEVHIPENGLFVHADEDTITQVIYNLIDNAVKFCNQSGNLFIQAVSDGSKATISIANTGTTIDAEELPFVFDRFHKLDKSRSMDRDGAGLGLYLVKTILVSHGEDISVTSRDGVTRFSFTLPIAN